MKITGTDLLIHPEIPKLKNSPFYGAAYSFSFSFYIFGILSCHQLKKASGNNLINEFNQ